MDRRPAGGLRSSRPAAIVLTVLALGCAGDPVAVPPPCEDAPRLALDGEPVTGILGPGDARRGGAWIHYFALDAERAIAVRIRMTSIALDPLLYLFDPGGALVGQAFPATPDAPLREAVMDAVLVPGCQLLGASSWADDAGAYTLTVSPLPATAPRAGLR